MIESLLSFDSSARIFILCLDNKVEELIRKYLPENCVAVPMNEFETELLLKIKSSRNHRSYCWTCTPFLIHHCLANFNLPSCTYIDADLCFYSSPQILLDELGSESVSIISHRYSPQYDQSKKSGIYCVQFMTFKNNVEGMTVLEWWRNACAEWCYDHFEDGKFGDQKYLDDWLDRFPSVKALSNIGGGVAPWNSQRYSINLLDNHQIEISEERKQRNTLVFYHFHGIRFFKSFADLGSYKLSKNFREILYQPYIKKIVNIDERLRKENLLVSPNNTQLKLTSLDLKNFIIRFIRDRIIGIRPYI